MKKLYFSFYHNGYENWKTAAQNIHGNLEKHNSVLKQKVRPMKETGPSLPLVGFRNRQGKGLSGTE